MEMNQNPHQSQVFFFLFFYVKGGEANTGFFCFFFFFGLLRRLQLTKLIKTHTKKKKKNGKNKKKRSYHQLSATLENEFQELFGMQLNACSPVINRILKKINDPTLNQEQKQSQMHHHPLHGQDDINSSRTSVRTANNSNNNNPSKSTITQFRLGSNFELHYEKNRQLFEIFCPKCRQDTVTTAIKSPFKEDHRIVFMGGFAYGTSTKELEDALAKYDAKMVDCKGISFRNYGWSFVKLETPQQAEDLIARSPIQIRGRNIDVRPFIDRRRVVRVLCHKKKKNKNNIHYLIINNIIRHKKKKKFCKRKKKKKNR
ncbi:hypothetical protein RFI_24595 [Reticulomyxa filosa]|uniref:RRM domain-containing protein n=1 Tax=Reticulomyxa filosa TaxID=46433 RepID=X6MFU9_RETFI|nr:hypothetical protein RFI_24595 [Reticulomyxa filosa]|eukprot:ETO12779.1 hypothetical protein RFI_24595 [Reticulomyxa filosa]